MLPPDFLEVLADPILDLFYQLEDSVITDMARRLKKMTAKELDAAAWQMQRLTESGALYDSVLEKLAQVTGKSEKELRAIFQEAGVKAMRFDDAIYRAAGLNPLPLNLSPAMAQTLAAGLAKTQGIMRNLTMTRAIQAQTAFIDAADFAYLQISTGTFSYQDALRQGVMKLADSGLSVINYASGHSDHLDVALRRTVLTGVSQTVGKLQERRADDLGADLVQVSAHIGARPTHQVWQGEIFSRSGTHAKYPDFVTSTGYGTGPGLMGWGCRHSWFPFFEGISAEHYKQAELENYADKKVTYNGQEMSFYDATQKQRAIERQIRQWTRRENALIAAGLSTERESAKVKAWKTEMKRFIAQTKLQRQRFREQVFA